MKEKQHLITFLRLLTYVKKLNYTTKSLTSEFRRYRFPLRDFLNYNNTTPNYSQFKKLKTFFDLVKNNFVIDSFSHDHYRMLITVPEVSVYIEFVKQTIGHRKLDTTSAYVKKLSDQERQKRIDQLQ